MPAAGIREGAPFRPPANSHVLLCFAVREVVVVTLGWAFPPHGRNLWVGLTWAFSSIAQSEHRRESRTGQRGKMSPDTNLGESCAEKVCIDKGRYHKAGKYVCPHHPCTFSSCIVCSYALPHRLRSQRHRPNAAESWGDFSLHRGGWDLCVRDRNIYQLCHGHCKVPRSSSTVTATTSYGCSYRFVFIELFC